MLRKKFAVAFTSLQTRVLFQLFMYNITCYFVETGTSKFEQSILRMVKSIEHLLQHAMQLNVYTFMTNGYLWVDAIP